LAARNQSVDQRHQAADAVKTLAVYRLWAEKFQGFVRSRLTDQLGGDEVRGFLTELAVRQGVAASTQNQAFNARAKSPLDLDPSLAPCRGQPSL
jgi:hypothetical protein